MGLLAHPANNSNDSSTANTIVDRALSFLFTNCMYLSCSDDDGAVSEPDTMDHKFFLKSAILHWIVQVGYFKDVRGTMLTVFEVAMVFRFNLFSALVSTCSVAKTVLLQTSQHDWICPLNYWYTVLCFLQSFPITQYITSSANSNKVPIHTQLSRFKCTFISPASLPDISDLNWLIYKRVSRGF